MRKRIIIATTVFFGIAIVFIMCLVTTIDPIRIRQTTFEFPINTELSNDASTYIKAHDNVLDEITFNFDNVDISILNTYKVYAYYRNKTYEFYIKIVDYQAPVLEAINQSVTVYVGESISAADLVTVTEDSNEYLVYFTKIKDTTRDTDINIESVGTNETIKFTTEGTYHVWIGAKDESENEAQAIRVRIDVGKDSVAPEINGIVNVVINKDSEFDKLKGVSARDNIDGDITTQLIVNGDVDTSTVGIYYVTYEISDSHGNTVKKERRIIVSNLTVPGDGDIQDIAKGGFMTQSEYLEMLELISTFYKSVEGYEVINKVSYINSYIVNEVVDINYDGSGSHRSYDVLVKKEANSRIAVARAFQMICDYLGIKCEIVYGQGYISNWAWNIVEIDGNYYHIDAYMNRLNKKEKNVYLLSDESMLELGYDWNQSSYPTCNHDY